MFQSTHLHEVWQKRGGINYGNRKFQSTHLHEVWPANDGKLTMDALFQSTHLHEVWPPVFIGGMTQYIVSIHTPTWGVTSLFGVFCVFFLFQSTHLHEVWPHEIIHLFCNKVSIHTPTWGVTLLIWTVQSVRFSFNPHTYMRCDDSMEKLVDICKVSIHTPTWGVTCMWMFLQPSVLVSIHTPTWGVTFYADLKRFA